MRTALHFARKRYVNEMGVSVIAPDLRSGVEALGNMIAEASSIVPFTGAGISTECGIPDFRSPGGLWTRNRPIPFDEFVAGPDARDEAWRRRFAMEPTFAAAKPGRGHRALASLYRAGKIPSIVTQNIDNLHQTSGFAAEHVVELHGNTTYARCIGCGQAYDLAWVKQRFDEIGGAPDCTVCDEPVKTCGARLVIINNEPTEQDDIADLVIRHDIGEALGPFVGN